jgi:hypothetical protein
MFPLTKKAMAAALAGAAIASSLGPSAAPAAPGTDTARTPCVAPPPSLIAASAGEEYARLRADCASRASTTQPVADESTVSGGFDAPSAAIGAAAGTGVVIVLLAAGGLARRGSPTRRQRPAVEVQK